MTKIQTLLLGLTGLIGAGAMAALGVVALPGIFVSDQLTSPAKVAETPSSPENISSTIAADSLEMAQEIPEIVTPPGTSAAPDFRGIATWINSNPLSLSELRGRVVLVDFWTYSCINCQRTLPHVASWHSKYAGHGLVVVGVHSPEFEFESVEANVREATHQQNVSWAVAMDNNFKTWRACKNRWWPHKFLIDSNGLIRYDHIGEGAYLETELHIRNLLTEAGYDVSDIPVGIADHTG